MREISRYIGLLALLLVIGCGEPKPWNVIVFTLDTTRADHLGCYGHPKASTPNIDALAADGVLFEEAVTAIPITTPSHSTIFTGRYPLAHGVRDNGLFVLPESEVTLAERLQEAGWHTGAAVGSYPVTREFGLSQGFDFYDDHITVGAEDFRGRRSSPKHGVYFDERPSAQVNDAILPWLRQHAQKPFFAWIHYWDPHQPHSPPPPYNQLFTWDLYLGEIAAADRSLGTIMKFLREEGIEDRTMVVVVADHGEGRGEHRELSHSMLLYNSTLHVPFIIKVPELEGGRRIAPRVGTVDLTPTVLDLLGLPVHENTQGRSLAGWIQGLEPASGRGLYYAETLSPRFSHGWGEMRALFEGDHKYIHGPRPELYQVKVDPGELQNRVDEPGERTDELKRALEAFIARQASQTSADAVQEMDAETRQRLAALGYISSGGAAPDQVVEELSEGGVAPQDRILDIALMSQAKQYLDQNDYMNARAIAERLTELDGNNAFYRSLLATAYLGLGRIEDAARLIEEAPELVSANDAAFLAVAQKVFALGEQDRGLAMVKQLVSSHDSAYGRYLLGEMRLAMGDEGGESELELAIQHDPKFERARLSYAVQLAKRGQEKQAEKQFKELLKRNPLSEKAGYNYAVMLLQLDRLDEALSYLDRAVELSPTYWSAHLARLAVFVDRDQEKEVATVLELLEQRCRNPRVLSQAREMVENS